jgi:hypothetical protein
LRKLPATAKAESHKSESSAFVRICEANMADGAFHRSTGLQPADPRLNHALAARRSLWAVCRCGREAAVDPAPWVCQGLGRQAVLQLETRLRCLCGARRVRLEIRGLAEAPHGVTGGIYVFR